MFSWFQYPFMLQALFACLAMGLILGYLGIHVVGRGIVFVDLGLGQLSSMGVAMAAYFEQDAVLWSMAFTLMGATIFSVLKVRDPRLRLEAIIGIFYAVSSAFTVLLISKTPHGEGDIQDVLFGNVLALSPTQIQWMLIVFGLVGVIHAILGKRFFALTYAKSSGETLSRQDHLYNFVFYILLAFVIVFAIRAGGVIPVFSFLIVPPVAAIMLSKRNGWVIFWSLTIAGLSSFWGLHFSFLYDFPAGATIVSVLGFFVLICFLMGLFLGRRMRSNAGLISIVLMGGSLLGQETQNPDPLPQILAEVQQLKTELASAQARISQLESQLSALKESQNQAAAIAAAPSTPPSALPAPSPAPARSTGLKLLDISIDTLSSAAASTAEESVFRDLQAGGHDPKNRGFTLQNLELTLSGVVDPYLRGDAHLVLQIDENGETNVEVEEVYLTTLALPAGLQVKAGTFFTDFGRLNPSHPHTWTFADQPVVLSRLFGPDGLRGPGAQLNWLIPLPLYVEASLGLQNAQGETAVSFRSEAGEEFAGYELQERPVHSLSDLLLSTHWKVSSDWGANFTLLNGVSYLRGPNASGPDQQTQIWGLDLYGKWKRPRNDHGFPFWSIQAEYLWRRYELPGQGLNGDPLSDEGGYVQWNWGFKRRWVAGIRCDWLPGLADFADDPRLDQRTRWAPNLTFYPSEFSKIRLQLNFDSADSLNESERSAILQFEFMMGAHGGHSF
ncbi:MAG: metal ABC transporter permease [Acidobacteria bacterium]|nr:metal ABC transporter permease [Acidobacteriota bacterium]MCB9397238.1 metal ABC transporter permease [Acidobacteriota bacterium]